MTEEKKDWQPVREECKTAEEHVVVKKDGKNFCEKCGYFLKIEAFAAGGTKDWFRFMPQGTGYLMIEGAIGGKPHVLQVDMRDEDSRNSFARAFMAMAEIGVKKVTVGEKQNMHERFEVEVSILPPEGWKGFL